jgi:hypothetical protein
MLTEIFDIARQAGAPTAVGELRHIAVRDYADLADLENVRISESQRLGRSAIQGNDSHA